MDVYKDNILDGMIYTFHFQNFPVAAAHLMLTQMIGSEACTLQYVQGIYKRIEDKKFSLRKPHLLDFPDHILENVVKNLDGESIPFQSHSDPGWAEFNYPNSNKKLMIRVYPHTIWFKGPCFKPHEERDGMMDFEDDDEEDWSDSEDESEEEVTDEEETSEEESDAEDSDADDN
ncbi:hypothetical protein CAEBREN_16340 [Caenorhabditis brenneri]|uniref:Uncharacterized protein n=1 Tax=Caenorhabditis brenneri TaxID=135651 RepID=G0N893_CAEBE|nr:hypothetical protein CAEBREN_16340 [Caenorhabditis brenneri]